MSQKSQQPQCWNPLYEAHARSTVLDQIRRESYGDDYSKDLKANSMVMLSELRWCAQALRLTPGSSFIDLGCGQGGPGLWVARAAGASLTGIDLSSSALSYASRHSASFVGSGRAAYFAADVTRLPLNDRSFSAVLSIDVFQLVPDKRGAFAELARVMRPDARLALTTRERRSSDTKVVIETIVADYEPLLAAAGFELLERHEPPGWEERHRRYYLRVLEMRDAISAEAGEDFEGSMVRDAQNVLSMLPGTRRVLIVARRTDRDAHR